MNAFARRSLVAALVWLAVTTVAQADDNETVRLLNMYAKSEAELFEVHIVADGDITGYKTTRKMGTDSYRLTVDVPAIPPVDSKYDVTTPFTRRFEMWPMKLGDKVYTRVMMEIDVEAASVVSQMRPTRILIKISRESPEAFASASAGNGNDSAGNGDDSPASSGITDVPTMERPPGPTVEQGTVPATGPGDGASPPEPPTVPTVPTVPAVEDPLGDDGTPTASPDESASGESQPPSPSQPDESPEEQGEFISLFPAPDDSRPLFETPLEQIDAVGGGLPGGILLGRFLFQPMAELSWIRGDNLTLQTDEKFADNAIYARAIAAFDLMESENSLQFKYELRYRNFRKFELLQENLSHGFNLGTAIHLSPRMTFNADNHFMRGSFETIEFDPGQEVFFNVEPFNRNLAQAGLQMELSERLAAAVKATYNLVRFQGDEIAFFSYDTATAGFNFQYRVSPLSSIFGEYVRSNTPEPAGRPAAKSIGNGVLAGMQGELTPLLTGIVRAGYSWQEFGEGASALDYRGFIASASLTRYFTEAASLTIEGGRQTNLSNFEDNNYYTTNFLNLQFTGPVRRNLQLLTGVSFFDNLYPRLSIEIPEARNDTAIAGWVGAAYFFTPMTYFRADYRHERRRSNLDQFEYSNNVIRIVVGLGFFTK
jgi:hypothetical protein